MARLNTYIQVPQYEYTGICYLINEWSGGTSDDVATPPKLFESYNLILMIPQSPNTTAVRHIVSFLDSTNYFVIRTWNDAFTICFE